MLKINFDNDLSDYVLDNKHKITNCPYNISTTTQTYINFMRRQIYISDDSLYNFIDKNINAIVIFISDTYTKWYWECDYEYFGDIKGLVLSNANFLIFIKDKKLYSKIKLAGKL